MASKEKTKTQLDDDVWPEGYDDPNQRPPVFKSATQEYLCLFSLTFAPSLTSLGLGIVQIGLPTIGRYYDIEGSTLSWALSAYSLTSGAFLLLFGSIADLIGRKNVVLWAYTWIAIWCLGSGFSPSFAGFAVMRALQGMSAAAAAPAAVGILGSNYRPGLRRNRVMAAFSAGAPLGFVFGAIAGGICDQFISWKASMWFVTIMYSFLAVLLYYATPADHITDWRESLAKLKELDFTGAGLLIVGMVLFTFALSQAESAEHKWKTPYIIVLIIIGALVLIGFFLYEMYIPRKPLMPYYLWQFSGFALVMSIAFFCWMTFGGVINTFMPLYFQNIRGYSPMLTVAAMLPQAVAGICVNIFAALFLHRIPGRILMLVAMVGFLSAALLWALMPPHLTYWAMAFPSTILSVIGADLMYNVANLHSLSAVPRAHQSTAAGTFNTILALGACIGVSAGSSISDSIVVTSGGNSSVSALVDGYRGAFWFGVGSAGLGLFGSLFLKIGTQGHNTKAADIEAETDQKHKKIGNDDDAVSTGAESATDIPR
ncbi:hypothetical protein CANCADRAFT_80956 [Tortispora caseinolytica NRRL Y-17796]|uniref:Major facilitator superfamily (MFS) profile domain-containing protein n=1 Tax=Tortispora caseinolytica NRRL Y-17796 TaxID=767744 RepID=A0A1E4TJU9_9ASCO|nr:hypothetical protein CANCADRAFT_80956 [Tortispora caseinolytica NRRL Y-17796]